ncbi:MAG: type IV pilus twitching motility protein PilT [Candidatus Uhrbacteria bacterium]
MSGTTKLNKLLSLAVKKGASDLHLMAGYKPVLRIDGQLMPVKDEPAMRINEMQTLVYDAIPVRKREVFKKKLELDFAIDIPGVSRYRVNVFVERGNMALAARVIPKKIPTMESLLMPEIIYDFARLDRGLVILTGPAGCGKSSSLAAMIELINNERATHIITMEDPIEFVFESKKALIAQRELGQDMLSFASGLKYALRQDPNIIMVGEMRDLETIAATLTLAETGHLVLATLHTPDAAQTVDRIIDVFPEHQKDQIRSQVSLSLKAVVAQRLLPKKGGGRVAAREIMINNIAIANLVRERKVEQINNVIQTSARSGMVTMDQDIKRLQKEGLIDKDIVE